MVDFGTPKMGVAGVYTINIVLKTQWAPRDEYIWGLIGIRRAFFGHFWGSRGGPGGYPKKVDFGPLFGVDFGPLFWCFLDPFFGVFLGIFFVVKLCRFLTIFVSFSVYKITVFLLYFIYHTVLSR